MTDIRYAIRSLAHSRRFAVGAILTFALGIGVNVAVFSAVDRMLFRTLPYARPDDLYVLRLTERTSGRSFGTLPALALVELRRQHQGFVDASTAGFPVGYTVSQDPEDEPPIRCTSVTYNTLAVFGIRPVVGHDFTRDDAIAKRAEVLVSYELWQRRFGGAADVVGRTLWANRQPVEIVGVLPQDFIAASSFLDPSSDGLALDPDTLENAGPRDRAFTPYVRLKPGVSATAAAAEANIIYDAVIRQLPPAPNAPPVELRLVPLKQALFGNYTDYLLLVVAAAGLVLVVACGNLASLMLVRFRSRERIAAMQAALGASSARLLMSAFVEAGLLSIAGAAIGLATLAGVSSGLRALLPAIFSRYASGAAEPRVVMFTILVAAASTAIVAMLPAWRLAHVDVMSVLRRSSAGTRGRRLSGRALIAFEAALSVLLVAAALGTARSLVTLEHVELGFDPQDLYGVNVRFPSSPNPVQRFDQYLRTLDAVRSLPGVRAAAGANDSFLNGSAGWARFGKGFETQGIRFNVTAGYFEATGTPILAGRTISTADVTDRALVAVLNQSAVHLLWPGTASSEAVGRYLPFDDEPRRQIVGVVADTRFRHAADARAEISLPLEPAVLGPGDIVVRTNPGVVLSVKDLRQRVREQVGEPTAIVVAPAARSIEAGLLDQQFRATLFMSFGAGALLLAAVGLYAVGAFEATRRRAEMGIRLALGASDRQIRRLILRDALAPVAIGVVAGLGVGVWAARFLQSFLFHVDARSPQTLALVALVLLGVTAVAAWIPARRAGRTDPALVLRAE
jgi:putative ABC transport system permease protein